MNRNWNAKQILVTGAGGFIASHLVERLVVDDASLAERILEASD